MSTITPRPNPITTPAALEARSLVVQRQQASTHEEYRALSIRIIEHQKSTRWRYWLPQYPGDRAFWTAPGGAVRYRIWDDDPLTTKTTTTEKET